MVSGLPKRHRSSRFLRRLPKAAIIGQMCNGGDVAGMTTGDDCAVAAVGGVVAAGGIAMAVGTAIGGGDLTTLRFGGCPLWSKALPSKADICSANAHVRP